jgi:hypothetical protein
VTSSLNPSSICCAAFLPPSCPVAASDASKMTGTEDSYLSVVYSLRLSVRQGALLFLTAPGPIKIALSSCAFLAVLSKLRSLTLKGVQGLRGP